MSQKDVYNLNVIREDEIEIPRITSREYLPAKNGAVISTLLPTNMFSFDANEAPLMISGSVELELANSRRKLKVHNLFDVAKVEEKVKYEVQVNLLSDKKDADGTNTAMVTTASMVGGYAAIAGLVFALA